MNLQNLLHAINECDHGELVFNLGNNRSFLYQKKWYPLRATINRARGLNSENELTTDRALLELSTILDYIRIGEIMFKSYLPVSINHAETIIEIKKIANILNSLAD
jgi:hypothetical protein